MKKRSRPIKRRWAAMWGQAPRIGQTERPREEDSLSAELVLTDSPSGEVAPLGADGQRDVMAQAKMHWFFGEWTALEKITPKTLYAHSERDRLALLVASAHAQLGSYEEARQHLHLALKWGCPPRLVAQVLIAGVHNSLGRAAAIAGDDRRMANHFRESVALTNDRHDTELLTHTRSVREMAKLGLLPKAVALVDEQIAKTKSVLERPKNTQARIRMLETEIELLHHELSLAQQRHQVVGSDRLNTSDRDGPPHNTVRVEEVKNRSVSQLGQDLWVLEQTKYKREGFFVEFGATDGVVLSNTLLLEREFGWNGICAEPNPKLFELLKSNRNCRVSRECISGQTGRRVEFVLADAYGGFAEYADKDLHAEKRSAYRDAGYSVQLETISLQDFLVKNGAPKDIDYLSVDTEGSEYEILRAFPFDEWNIALITVEHNFTEQRPLIRNLLGSFGYSVISREWEDWFYREETNR